jgi:GDP-L-fucose synthase
MPRDNYLLLGANGFLGRWINYARLAHNYVRNSKQDLRDPQVVKEVFDRVKPNVVINAAGFNGGIQFNLERPSEILTNNTLIATNVMNQCIEHKVDKVVSILASCAYDSSKELLTPEDLMTGAPHPSVAAHGYAKRHYMLLSQFAHKQYGINAVCATLPTLYGNYGIEPSKAKVLDALIQRFVNARMDDAPEVVVWGDGSARRQFAHGRDAGEQIWEVVDRCDYSDVPYHLCCTSDISILELAEIVKAATNYKGRITLDLTKPNGQYRKQLMPSPKQFTYRTPMLSLEKGIASVGKLYGRLETGRRIANEARIST